MASDLLKTRDEIRYRLRDYLIAHGVSIDTHGRWVCFNPDHKDSEPSAHFVPGTDETIWKCFGCQQSGDVFTASNLIEGLPTDGPGFIHSTIATLCEQFGMGFDPEPLSDQNKHLMHVSEILNKIRNTIPRHANYGIMEDQGILAKTCEESGVFGIPDMKTLVAELRNQGLSSEDLRLVEFRTDISDQHVVFEILDHRGSIVGYSYRRPYNSEENPKYKNPSNDQGLYHKKELLYGLHRARKDAFRHGVIIVEGYTDVLAFRQFGLDNVVAVCSTELSNEQVDLIRSLGISKVILCYDHDPEKEYSGRSGMIKTLSDEGPLAGRQDFSVQVLDIEALAIDKGIGYNLDPREALVDEGLAVELFSGKYTIPGFQWLLRQLGSNPRFVQKDVVDKAIALIVNEPHNVSREDMLVQLSRETGVRLSALQRELDSRLRKDSQEIRDEMELLRNDTLRVLRNAPVSQTMEQFERILDKFNSLKHRVAPERDADSLDQSETIRAICELREELEALEDGLLGWRTGLQLFDNTFGGLPKEGKVVVVTGDPNAGKSSLARQLSLFCAYNEYDNPSEEPLGVRVITMDDSRKEYLIGMVSMLANIPRTLVRQPSRIVNPSVRARFDQAWDDIHDFVHSGVLDVKDMNHIADQEDIFTIADACRVSGRIPLLFIDSVQSLLQDRTSDDEYREELRFINKLHAETVKRRFTAIVVSEKRKGKQGNGKGPDLEDLQGRRGMGYRPHLVLHHQNTINRAGSIENTEAGDLWYDNNRNPNPYAIITILKNKLNSIRQSFRLEMHLPTGLHYEGTDDD